MLCVHWAEQKAAHKITPMYYIHTHTHTHLVQGHLLEYVYAFYMHIRMSTVARLLARAPIRNPSGVRSRVRTSKLCIAYE